MPRATSLPPAASYRQLAETAQRGGNAPEAIRCFLVCGDLGDAAEIGRLFVEFQKYLYEKSKVA